MIEKEWFPKAFEMGITWVEFWSLNPHSLMLMIDGYNEKQKSELTRSNYLSHLQGVYMVDAIMSTVGNMFKKKNAKPYKYPEKPHELGEKKPLTEYEKSTQLDLFVAQLKAMKSNFDNQKQGQ